MNEKYGKNGKNWETNKFRWYPQQPKGYIFSNLSEACCDAALGTPQLGFPELTGCKSC
jgi:hypothetical protein